MEISNILSIWNLRESEIIDQYHSDTVRKIYRIRSSGQDYLIKGIPDSVPKSEIYSNVRAHLFLGNEKRIAPKLYATPDGLFYVHSDGYWFYLMEYIDGRAMEETTEDELLLVKLVRKLHSFSDYNVKSPMSQNKERFYDWFIERKFKKEFDSILDTLPDFSEYDQCLIHSDIGPHNAMIRSNGEAVFIDLDDSGIGSRFLDLGWPFIMQFVDFNHETEEMKYRFDLAEMFLKGYYGEERISRSEYDLIWQGAIYMHISYMKCYGPDAEESLWRILKFGMKQKEMLWERINNMKVYYSDNEVTIRNMKNEDAKIIFDTYLSYGWHPSMETYEKYYSEQEENKRVVFIAEYEGRVSGLCTLVLNPTEGPWANVGYPEIVDLTVFFHVHNKGIGNKLLDVAEGEASKIADTVYLAVGIHSGYGAAQRIYVKRGYIPDGNGAWYQGKILDQYAPCCNDDELVIFMSKKLS